MGKLRSISTVFWSDPFIEELTPSEKLLFVYLITNEKTNMLGVYESSIKKISFETGIENEVVLSSLKRFESLKKIKRVGNWIVLMNFLKHQNFNTNMKKSAIGVYNNLPKELKFSNIDLNKGNPSEGFETLCKGFGTVRKVEVEVEEEYETEIEEEEEEEIKFDSDSIFDIEVLKEQYLNNDRVIQAVLKEPKNKFKDINHLESRLRDFIAFLVGQAETLKTMKDFASHFRNWHISKERRKGFNHFGMPVKGQKIKGIL